MKIDKFCFLFLLLAPGISAETLNYDAKVQLSQDDKVKEMMENIKDDVKNIMEAKNVKDDKYIGEALTSFHKNRQALKDTGVDESVVKVLDEQVNNILNRPKEEEEEPNKMDEEKEPNKMDEETRKEIEPMIQDVIMKYREAGKGDKDALNEATTLEVKIVNILKKKRFYDEAEEVEQGLAAFRRTMK